MPEGHSFALQRGFVVELHEGDVNLSLTFGATRAWIACNSVSVQHSQVVCLRCSRFEHRRASDTICRSGKRLTLTHLKDLFTCRKPEAPCCHWARLPLISHC